VLWGHPPRSEFDPVTRPSARSSPQTASGCGPRRTSSHARSALSSFEQGGDSDGAAARDPRAVRKRLSRGAVLRRRRSGQVPQYPLYTGSAYVAHLVLPVDPGRSWRGCGSGLRGLSTIEVLAGGDCDVQQCGPPGAGFREQDRRLKRLRPLGPGGRGPHRRRILPVPPAGLRAFWSLGGGPTATPRRFWRAAGPFRLHQHPDRISPPGGPTGTTRSRQGLAAASTSHSGGPATRPVSSSGQGRWGWCRSHRAAANTRGGRGAPSLPPDEGDVGRPPRATGRRAGPRAASGWSFGLGDVGQKRSHLDPECGSVYRSLSRPGTGPTTAVLVWGRQGRPG